jgi:hypothetical protein
MNRHVVLVGRVALVLLGMGTVTVVPAWPAQAEAFVTRTVVLRPTPGPSLRIDFDYHLGNTLPPFEREPALGNQRTLRG